MKKTKENESCVMKSPAMKRALSCVQAFRTTGTKTDVQGWYTGLYKDPTGYGKTNEMISIQGKKSDIDTRRMYLDNIKPVQDADDL